MTDTARMHVLLLNKYYFQTAPSEYPLSFNEVSVTTAVLMLSGNKRHRRFERLHVCEGRSRDRDAGA